MRTTVNTTTTYNLEGLTPKEARMLKAMVQNGPEDEDEDWAEFRKKVWYALPSYDELDNPELRL